jgi:hypothetical protein
MARTCFLMSGRLAQECAGDDHVLTRLDACATGPRSRADSAQRRSAFKPTAAPLMHRATARSFLDPRISVARPPSQACPRPAVKLAPSQRLLLARRVWRADRQSAKKRGPRRPPG